MRGKLEEARSFAVFKGGKGTVQGGGDGRRGTRRGPETSGSGVDCALQALVQPRCQAAPGIHPPLLWSTDASDVRTRPERFFSFSL